MEGALGSGGAEVSAEVSLRKWREAGGGMSASKTTLEPKRLADIRIEPEGCRCRKTSSCGTNYRTVKSRKKTL